MIFGSGSSQFCINDPSISEKFRGGLFASKEAVQCLKVSIKKRPCGRVRRRLPIFPYSCPYSIIGEEELNYRVRDGNGCALFANVTSSPAHTGVLDIDIVHHACGFVNPFLSGCCTITKTHILCLDLADLTSTILLVTRT